MPRTASARRAASLAARVAKGHRRVNVVLPPDAVASLARVQAATGLSVTLVIAEALRLAADAWAIVDAAEKQSGMEKSNA